jgi:hypothetical protein
VSNSAEYRHEPVITQPASIIACNWASQPAVDLWAKTTMPTPLGRVSLRPIVRIVSLDHVNDTLFILLGKRGELFRKRR